MALLLVGSVLLAGVMWFAGCPVLRTCFVDNVMLLDCGARLLEGQRPHGDFYSPVGVLPYLMTAGGIALVGPGPKALGASYLLAFPLVTAWAWWLAKERWAVLPAALVTIMIGGLLAGSHPIGFVPVLSSYAMQYNRLGWALICLLAVQAMLPPRRSSGRLRQVLEGISAGLITSLLFFVKINLFGSAVVIVLLGFVLARYSRLTWAAMACAAALGFAGLLCYLRFDVSSILADLHMLGAVQTFGGRLMAMAIVLKKTILSLSILVAAAVALSRGLLRYKSCRGYWIGSLLLAGIISALGIFISSANCEERPAVPFLGLAALVLWEVRTGRTVCESAIPPLGERTLLAAGLMVAVLAGHVIAFDLGGIAYALASRSTLVSPIRINSPRLAGMALGIWPGDGSPQHTFEFLVSRAGSNVPVEHSPQATVVVLNDGIALLTRHVGASDRLFVMDACNMFTPALGLRHPRGDPAFWWNYGKTVTEASCPSPARVLGEVTMVMEPKVPSTETTLFMKAFYGPSVYRDFVKIDESALWVLYRRKA